MISCSIHLLYSRASDSLLLAAHIPELKDGLYSATPTSSPTSPPTIGRSADVPLQHHLLR